MITGAQKVVAAAVLEDKIRLIRGQSTANIAILVQAIEDLQRKKWEEFKPISRKLRMLLENYYMIVSLVEQNIN